ERDGRHRLFAPPFAQLRAALPHVLDVVGDRVDPRADAAAIRFQFRLAGSARADSTAEAREGVAGAGEPRQQVFQLGELDLQLAFARAGATGEDVEDQLRAIDDLAAHLFLDVAKLRRRQLVVEDDDVDVELRRRGGQRLDFAGAEKGGRIRFRPLLHEPQHHRRTGRLGEPGQLVERSLRLEASRVAGNQPDERRPLRPRHPRCRHRSISFHAIAPARINRGSVVVASTIVDGAPPGVFPVSINKSIRSPSVRSTSSGSAVACCPLMFALVAVTGRPARRQISPATSCAGTRTATVPLPAVTPAASAAGAGTTIVSGPGQKRSASRTANGGSGIIPVSTCATSAAISGKPRSSGRRFTSNRLFTASVRNGSTASPYNVSVG